MERGWGWVGLNEKEESSHCQRTSNARDELSCPHAHRGMENGWVDICWKISISPPAFEEKKKRGGTYLFYDMSIGVLLAWVSVHHVHAWCLQRSYEGVGTPETGVMGQV